MSIKIPKIKKRHSFKSKLASAAMGLVALAIIAFLAVSNWRIYKDRRAMDDDIKKTQDQIQVLQERATALQAGLTAAQGEGFQEEKMREQGYKKPGEEVIAVLQDNASSATKQDAANGDNFWLNLWQKIKGVKQ
jgi:cell division protein FtsB